MDFLFCCISDHPGPGAAKSTTLFYSGRRRNGPPRCARDGGFFNEGWRPDSRRPGQAHCPLNSWKWNGVADDPFEGRIVVTARRNCWASATAVDSRQGRCTASGATATVGSGARAAVTRPVTHTAPPAPSLQPRPPALCASDSLRLPLDGRPQWTAAPSAMGPTPGFCG